MIEFGFTEEQEMFRQEMKRFIKEELAPLAKNKKFAEERKKANEGIQLNTLNLPERIGGWTLDYVSTGILMEELILGGSSLFMMPFWTTFQGHDLKKLPDEVQDELGPGVINGTKQIRHGFTEANSGNEQAAIRTRAVRQGDYYIVNGEKQPSSGSLNSTHSVVTAVTDPSAGVKGISAILVPADLPGVSSSALDFDKRVDGACVMTYEDVKVPVKYLLGEEGEGLDFLQFQHIWASNVALALRYVSHAKAAVNEMIELAGQRVHYGQPIIKNQGVSFQFAENYTRLEAARLLIYRVLYLMDQNNGYVGKKDLSMAKWYGMDVAQTAIIEMVKIGGYQYLTEELPMGELVLKVVSQDIADGAPQIHKLRILSEIAPDAIPPHMFDRLVC